MVVDHECLAYRGRLNGGEVDPGERFEGCSGQRVAADVQCARPRRILARWRRLTEDIGVAAGRSGRTDHVQFAQVAAPIDDRRQRHDRADLAAARCSQDREHGAQSDAQDAHVGGPRAAPDRADGGNHVLRPEGDLIGARIDVGGVAGSTVIESKRGDAERGGGFGDGSQDPVRGYRLGPEGIADHEGHVRSCGDGWQVQPTEEAIASRFEVEGIGVGSSCDVERAVLRCRHHRQWSGRSIRTEVYVSGGAERQVPLGAHVGRDALRGRLCQVHGGRRTATQ